MGGRRGEIEGNVEDTASSGLTTATGAPLTTSVPEVEWKDGGSSGEKVRRALFET